MVSCGDDPTCISDNTSLVKIRFSDSVGVAKNIILTKVSTVANPDVYTQYDNNTLNSLVLAMNSASQNTTVIFETPTGNDTLDLIYKVTPIFISAECGIDMSFSALDTLSSTFDELEIKETIFHEDITLNIEIIH